MPFLSSIPLNTFSKIEIILSNKFFSKSIFFVSNSVFRVLSNLVFSFPLSFPISPVYFICFIES